MTDVGITIEPHDHGATVVTLRGELDRDAAAPNGVALHVVGAHGIVRKVFELTGTETLIADW